MLSFIGGILACFAEHADGKVDKSAPASCFFVAGFLLMVGWVGNTFCMPYLFIYLFLL
jgi:hypothetical protein